MAVGVFFLMVINTEAGVRQIEPIYLDVARAYRIRPISFYFGYCCRVRCRIFTPASSSVSGSAIVLAVASEFQLTRVGLGFAIFNAQQLLDVDRLYAALVAVSLLGCILTYGLDLTERWAIPWRRTRK